MRTGEGVREEGLVGDQMAQEFADIHYPGVNTQRRVELGWGWRGGV